MDKITPNRQELIQRYVDQTIDADELRLFQEMLKEDVSLREELLLYVRMDVAIREYILFHNYMDENVREGTPEEKTAAISPTMLSRIRDFYRNIVASLFPKTQT